MAGHEDAGVVTGHVGAKKTNLYPLAGDDRDLTLLKRGLCKFGWVWSSLTHMLFGRQSGAPSMVEHFLSYNPEQVLSEVSKRGWREGVGDKHTPKNSPKSSPAMCPPSPKGAA